MEGQSNPDLSIWAASIRERAELAVEIELDRKREVGEPIIVWRDEEIVTLLPGDEGYYRVTTPFDSLGT